MRFLSFHIYLGRCEWDFCLSTFILGDWNDISVFPHKQHSSNVEWIRNCANSDIFFQSHGFSIYQSFTAIFSYLSKHVAYECEILNTVWDIISIPTTETDTSAIVTWHHCCKLRTIQDYKVWFWDILDQGWWTYGMQKDFLGTWHSLLSQFFLFLWHNRHLYIVKNMCIYTHIWRHRDCIRITVATK